MDTVARVIVVDDEEPIRRSLKTYLEDEGFAVVCADSAEQALAVLANGCADGAIVDIRLPGMDGGGFIECARRGCPEMVFLICTGSVGFGVPEHLKALGVGDEDVFPKPITDMALLAAALRRRMDTKRWR